MKLRAPVVTLAAVAVLGAVLLAVNLAVTPATPPAAQPAVAAAPATTAPATTAPPPPAAEPATPPPVVAEQVWAGRSEGHGVTVAIAVKDGKAVAYICDGKRIEAWLTGTLTGDQLELNGPRGAHLDGTASAASAAGTVTAGGKSWRYTAKGVHAPEGLYEGRADVRGVATRIGWIVVDGTQTGLGRSGEDVEAAPVLNPAHPDAVVVDGQPVAVRSGAELVAS